MKRAGRMIRPAPFRKWNDRLGEIEQQELAFRRRLDLDLGGILDRGTIAAFQALAVDGDVTVDDLHPGAAALGEVVAERHTRLQDAAIELEVLVDAERLAVA